MLFFNVFIAKIQNYNKIPNLKICLNWNIFIMRYNKIEKVEL